MNDRIARVQAALDEAGIDALLVGSPVDDVLGAHSANRRYLSGFSGSAGYVLVTRDRALFSADFRYVEQAEAECEPNGVEVWQSEGGMAEWLPELIGETQLAGKTVGLSRADTTLAVFTGLWEIVGQMPAEDAATFVPAPPIVEDLRVVKDAAELALLERAIGIGDTAFAQVAETIDTSMTERQVADAVAAAVRRAGGDGIAFDTIVASGPWGARPHATPRDEAIAPDAPIVIDMGARADGYCSDLTRSIVAGSPTPRFREVYEIVLEAQQNAIERVEAGMTGKDAHELAESVIERYGYGEAFGHGLGHGVGLEVHERPYLGQSSNDTLDEGMVFTIEPGIYLSGWGGIRIEDIVVLEGGRARVLSHAPKLTLEGADA